MRPHSRVPSLPRLSSLLLGGLISFCAVGWALVVLGQSAPSQTPPPGPRPRRDTSGDYRLSVEVDLVVLHTTVIDRQGHINSDLQQEHFRVYENGARQEIAVFRQEDLPLTVGLVIDNSSSMQKEMQHLRQAALTFVETSNPLDEVFVVNFNDDYYLDLGPGRDFSSDISELKEALEKTDTRGGTALWDAVRASLDHARRGTRQKHVLLVITDGVDRYSRTKYDALLRYAQEQETALYIVQLRGSEDPRDWKRARRQLRKLAEVTGGDIYFPVATEDIVPICRQIAHDIRNQYILAYYPTNRARDGSFRTIKVEIKAPGKFGPLIARTRTGYYAPAPEAARSANP